MFNKTESLTSGTPIQTRFRIQLPAEHGAVVTFLLGLVLAIALSVDKQLSSIVSLFFFSIFCSYRNIRLRTLLAASAIVFLLFYRMPFAIITVLALYSGRTLMKLFSRVPLDFKQGGALTLMSILPVTAVVIGDPSNFLLILSRFAIFFHATLLSTSSVFWFLKHKWSSRLFLFCAAVILFVLWQFAETLLPQILALDAFCAAALYANRQNLSLKKAGIINGIYLGLIALRLI